jgi:hypothetical protein
MERNVLKGRLVNKETEFLPSSCLVAVRFRFGIGYACVQTIFAGSVYTQCKCNYPAYKWPAHPDMLWIKFGEITHNIDFLLSDETFWLCHRILIEK